MKTQVLTALDGPVGTLTLQPPEGKPPTLDHDVIAELDAALERIEARAGTLRAVVIRSGSPKVCARAASSSAAARASCHAAWRGGVSPPRREETCRAAGAAREQVRAIVRY